MIHIRPAGPIDAAPMADLLNAIIAAGGTTAMTDPVTPAMLKDWMRATPGTAAWHLAEDNGGTLLGFQWIEPKDALPPEACDIATFVQIGRAKLGIGSALFDRTRDAAISLGYRWINATIRADNTGGLAYYQSRGFETYDIRRNVPLPGGVTVDRISKRFDL
ncbi:MAG: GNAT family N-acetyltransferase [Roseovarius sp.]|uniref:GNAT family N-acetyltransferase n=1 Tax=Roseovarius sp. TaxID=1486281 RepID=UPI0032EC9ECC